MCPAGTYLCRAWKSCGVRAVDRYIFAKNDSLNSPTLATIPQDGPKVLIAVKRRRKSNQQPPSPKAATDSSRRPSKDSEGDETNEGSKQLIGGYDDEE